MSLRRSGRGRLDRNKTIRFTFDGQAFSGLRGDSLASALIANGVHLIGRSFKYHRPRGIVAAGAEEANALVTIDRGAGRVTPNVRATTQELFDGLCARSQNHWPSLKYDAMALNDALAMFFPAGFYNKTFMWPGSFWDRVYEPLIRSAAGLGRAPSEPDRDCYASSHGHCETLVIGAGPAGIAAALAASASGERVILADEQSEAGGSLLFEPDVMIDGMSAWAWLDEALAVLRSRDNVRLMTRTSVFGYYHDNFLGACQRLADHKESIENGAPRECLHRLRAGRVILATGAIERPLVFAENDRPGIMLASAARCYLNRYGVAVGETIAVFTSHDSAYQAAFDLSDAGINIAAVVDARQKISDDLLAQALERGIDVRVGAVVTATRGRHRIREITVSRVADGRAYAVREKISCDGLLMSGGWSPSVHLFSQARGGLTWRGDIGAYVPDLANEKVVCAGAVNGTFDLAEVLIEGDRAGGGNRTFAVNAPFHCGGGGFGVMPTNRNEARIKAFVDFQNDVIARDIKLAVREGFRSIEHVKRYTTSGMATDQGKTSNLNALQIASAATRRPVTDVGLTTFRPPYTPTTFGCLVGHNDGALFEVTRKTPIDDWAEANGAAFEPVGLWRRARYFPRGDEDMARAVARECQAVRRSVGIFDASSLGKIEVVGPDAAEFLNRIYTASWSGLGVGRCRYGLMLGEDGYIMDDGVVGRLGEDRFHVTTTTGGAAHVLARMEDYLQTEWPELDVWLTSTTEQWAVIALSGPKTRRLLEPLVAGIDLSPGAFPHMALREAQICGIKARLFRVSFCGELGFEINVPAHCGRALWQRLVAGGREFDITPYGTEAMHVLRAEKGFMIVGQDTDGTVSPQDMGLGWAIDRDKKDFVGKRSLARRDLTCGGRKQFVGLLTSDPNIILEEGAQIVADPDQQIPVDMIGHVTSSYWSPALGRSIALALVKDGRALIGKTIYLPMPDETHSTQITSTVFYDPEGERLNVV